MTAHRWFIDPKQYERHEQRRGRRHAFETLTPTNTALVVVDMVPFFVDANAYTRGIVANVNRLARALRDAGGVVAWVTPAPVEPLPAKVEFFGPEVAGSYRRSGGGGSPQARLSPLLDVDDQDLCVEKSTTSAFFPDGSSLTFELDDRGIGTVLLVGTVANVCVESSARDASTLGYRTILVADAVSAVTDADLNATLHTIYRSFGDVRPTDEIVGLLDPGP